MDTGVCYDEILLTSGAEQFYIYNAEVLCFYGYIREWGGRNFKSYFSSGPD